MIFNPFLTGKKRRKEKRIQDEQNRNILFMAVNWGNTSLNPRGGVSSFRFLHEEKEQNTLFYLCGPPAQLSFSLLSLPLFPSCYASFTVHRCGLFSVQVVCMCMWSLISSPEMPPYPCSHLCDLSFLLALYLCSCKTLNSYKTQFSISDLLWCPSLFVSSNNL